MGRLRPILAATSGSLTGLLTEAVVPALGAISAATSGSLTGPPTEAVVPALGAALVLVLVLEATLAPVTALQVPTLVALVAMVLASLAVLAMPAIRLLHHRR